jgi:hypothetical protein
MEVEETDLEEVNVSERVAFGNGGWVRVESPPELRDPDQIVPPGYVLLARLGFSPPSSERLVPLEIFLYRSDGGPVSAAAWRRVKLGTFEERVNDKSILSTVVNRSGTPGPQLWMAAQHFATTWGTRQGELNRPHWVADMFFSQIPDSGVSAPTFELNQDRGELWTTWMEVSEDLDLNLHLPRETTDDFLEEVAEMYRILVAAGQNPAPTIAEANDVQKVTTVHYWIRKARERGMLPVGRRGKAG